MGKVWLPGDSDFARAMRGWTNSPNEKPNVAAEIDRASYLGNNCRHAVLPGISNQDIGNASFGTLQNYSFGVYYGIQAGLQTSRQSITAKTISYPYSIAARLICVTSYGAGTRRACTFGDISQQDNVGILVSPYAVLGTETLNFSSASASVSTSAASTAGAIVDVVVNFATAASRTIYAYVNGTYLGSATDTTDLSSQGSALGQFDYFQIGDDSEFRVAHFYVFDCGISDPEVFIREQYRILKPANDTPFLISVPAGGGVTGTGDLVGAGSEVVGTGTRTVTGAGALEGQGAAVVGTGERTVTGTGALIGQGSDVAGTGATGGVHTGVGDLIGAGSEVVGVGYRTVTGTGVLVAQGSEVVGVGERTVIGSGDLVGAGAEVSGSGAVGGITTGTGDLVGAGSEIVGTGLRTVTGSGALVAQGSAVTGTGERVITGAGALVGSGSEIVGVGVGGDVTTGAGALVGQGSAVTGTGTRKITGVGELVAAGSIIVGSGLRTITGSGALVGAGSEVVGGQTEHDFETGNTNTWMLGPRGRVWSLENRDPYDAHKRGREVCS